MATTALAVTAKLGDTEAARQMQTDPTKDNPQQQTGEEQAQQLDLTPEEQEALMQVRKTYKDSYVTKRNTFIRRALRAFEVLKNNPYILYNETTADYDSLAMILQGTAGKEDIDLYQYQDNIYQMLALAFIAALSVDNPRVRYQPVDAQNEEDIEIAKKASTIHAFNERQNNIDGLQQLELLYFWCTGSYFTYTRHIIDRNRAGVSKSDIMAVQEMPVLPARFVCPQCGAVTPEDQINPLRGTAKCPECGSPLGQADWHEPQTLPLPVKVGEVEEPNGMTAFNVYSGLNVDVDPDQNELYDCPILDLEVECPIALVRSKFPKMYRLLQENATGDGSQDGEFGKRARQMITNPAGTGASLVGKNNGTYSRCWIQADAFAVLDDEGMANNLKSKFPNGVRLVTYSQDIFLQAVPERMMDRWTWCPTIKGVGMYPFGAGDATLDIQARINDAANTIHAYLDRLAFGTILADGDAIDAASMDQKSLVPGNFTFVNRTDEETGQKTPLEDLLFQPQFHIDSHIFEYEPNLIQLAQVISGVQPQVFGGSDPNVQTAAGQRQALQTATGRLMLYRQRIREERAARAKNSVVCSVENMDDQLRIVIEGEAEGDYQTEVMLKNQLTGDFLAYPEDEEGFPATYEQIQSRLMELLTQGAKSPFVAALLSDPDTQRVVARYILPDEVKLPGDAARARIKIILQQLSHQKPIPGPIDAQTSAPSWLPSIQPNPNFDDLGMCVDLTKQWLQQNWQMQQAGPQGAAGFANVLAFLRVCVMMNTMQMAKAAIVQGVVAGQQGGGQPGAGPARKPIPQLGPGGPQ